MVAAQHILDGQSYRTILKSGLVMGGAAMANGALGLLRNKVAALYLGPAGMGVIGLYLNVMQAGAMVSALGTSAAGARQIAATSADEQRAEQAHGIQALVRLTLLLALIGGATLFTLRHVIAEKLLHDPGKASEVGWLAVGIFLTVAAGSQQAVLTGLRRTAHYARMQIIAAVLSAFAGIFAVIWLGQQGIIPFVITAPLALFLCGHWYVRKIERVAHEPIPLPKLLENWRSLITVGLSFVCVGAVSLLGLLAVRSMIQAREGIEALGQFQAAWLISSTITGFVLNAMATDYMPRLAALITDQPAARQLANQQSEVAMLIAGPVILAMMALAPWLAPLLYSAHFGLAGQLYQIMALGDLLRVASWPLGLILAVSGRGRGFMLIETGAMGIFLAASFLLLPHWGISASAWAFALMYAVYLITSRIAVALVAGFFWSWQVIAMISIQLAMAATVLACAQISVMLAAVCGLCLAMLLAVYAIQQLKRKAGLSVRPHTAEVSGAGAS